MNEDPGGKGLSQVGRDFFIQEVRNRGLSAADKGGPGRPSVVEVSGRPIWVKALQSAYGLVPLSYKPEWTFYGRLLVVVTNIRLSAKTHPNAVIYALTEDEAQDLANGRNSIRKRDFREQVVEKQAGDEWWGKLRAAIGADDSSEVES